MREEVRELPEKVVEHLTDMAEFLANYRSGKMPSTFKVNLIMFFLTFHCSDWIFANYRAGKKLSENKVFKFYNFQLVFSI